MLDTIVGALLPVILTLLLGALAGWRHDEDSKAAGAMNRMVLRYALPLALFAGTVGTPRASLLEQGPLAVILLVGTVVPYAIAFALRYAKSRDLGASALQAMGFGFPSIPFTAIAILTPVVGTAAILVVAVGGSVINIFVVPATLAALAIADRRPAGGTGADQPPRGGPDADRPTPHGAPARTASGTTGGGLAGVIVKALLSPIVLAPAVALVLVLSGVTVPKSIVGAFKLLGNTVGGVALFASGVILQAQKPTLSWAVVITTVGRNLVVPAVALGVLVALHVDPHVRKLAVLALALPAAALQITLAVEYQTGEKENASFLLYSNVACVASLALFMWLLK